MSAMGPERYRTRAPFFEPLNAKKLERPAALQRTGHCLCAPMPRNSDVVESCLVNGAGVSWWKRPTRGSKLSTGDTSEYLPGGISDRRYGQSLRIL